MMRHDAEERQEGLGMAAKAALARIRRDGLKGRPDPFEEGGALLVRPGAGASLAAGRLPRGVVEELLAGGHVRWQPGTPPLLVPAAGADGGGDGRSLAVISEREADGTLAQRLINERESPLLWLSRRRDANGAPLLAPRAFAAGERFRKDFTLANHAPSITTNWSRLGGSGDGAAAAGPAGATDAALAARQRVRAACSEVGAEMAGLLIDVCGFLVPLEEVERQRRWPRRSGKLVLQLALGRLADHYGLADAATGPDRGRPVIAAWRAPDAEATLAQWL